MPARRPNPFADVGLAHVVGRLRLALTPNVTVVEPPDGIRFDRDVPVAVRDGTILRVNVFRPDDRGEHPVLLCAHPYGKDALPKPRRRGGYATHLQLRMIPQSRPFRISAWTSWESPDPAFWVPRGYVVVNADLRGWGRSQGTGTLLSDEEGRDVHDLVEWAAAQAWSTGRVGLNGVSYLALSQWAGASERPPHLAAICPWEGFTDAYRDFLRPGGVRETGFVRLWSSMLRRQRRSPVDVVHQQRCRPCFDDWWAARNREIERIDVPALVCGSFSDHNLHSRGSFEGFRRIGSKQKWLYTHRGPKWATYYSPEALEAQARFFDHFLRGDDNGMEDEPPVRVEVRASASEITAVRGEDAWPPAGTSWEPLHLDPSNGRLASRLPLPASASFDTRRERASFTWRFTDDTELVGPMWLRAHLEVREADDVFLFAGVRKVCDGTVVGFEGSYGFDRALVTFGFLKASQRATDPSRSLPWLPFHPHRAREPTVPGQIISLDLELQPSATLFRAGEELRLDLQGRWFFARNPLFGQFPAAYERSPKGTCVLHCGGEHDSALHVPRR